MGMNNQLYKHYSEMTKGYRENNSGLFENAVLNLMRLNPDNPFEIGTEEAEYFFEMEKGYTLWAMGGVDARINRRRMLAAAQSLCKLNPKRPYKFNKEEDAKDREKAKEELAAAEAQAQEEAKLEEERRIAEEAAAREAEEEEKDIVHVFGVLPQTKQDKETKELRISRLKNLFKR